MSGGAAGGLPAWFDPDDERLARAAWSRLTEPGDKAAVAFVDQVGAAAALRAVATGAPVGGHRLLPRWSVRLPVTDPHRDLATLARFGGRLVVPGDDEWPGQLDDLGARRPFCLWVRGPLRIGLPAARTVAVVGSRASTGYGEDIAARIAEGCAARGLVVVSGAALGIDAAAHRGALGAGGGTVAVLACGVDRVYPRSNELLLGRIVGHGAVVSEVPPVSAPTRRRFVERNRLIAALAGMTVVVEAAWRSGAMVTAREAEELSRYVGAVPGPVTSPESAGCHRLLRERGATCITGAADVHELVAPLGTAPEPPPPQLARGRRRPPGPDLTGLPETDLQVLDAVPVRSPAGVASVARAAGLEPATVTAALGRLELLGLVDRELDAWMRVTARTG